MKTINVAALKAHLSQCLREASAGARILVLDRDRPVAELVPPPRDATDPFERLARLGRMRAGTQDWKSLKISPLKKKRFPAQELLRKVREDVR